MKVAVVGVGNMGAPMAACIARAGHVVTVFDSSLERAAKDIKIAADLTRDLELDSAVVRLVSARFDQARDALGYGADNSEAIKAWKK